jgi:DNA integrity scanning protein DisA with diadenylate cyclase activity
VVSIVTIIIILELIFFVVLAFLIGENIILEMVSNTLERAIEIIYCLIIIFTHRRNLKADKKQSQTMPTQKDDTQHSTNANPSVNDSKE